MRRDRQISQRSRVGDEADFARRLEVLAENEIAAFGKGPSHRESLGGIDARVSRCAPRPPTASGFCRRKRRSSHAWPASRKSMAPVARSERNTSSSSGHEPHQHPLIRIANQRHVAANIHHTGNELEHDLEPPPILLPEVAVVGARHQARHEHHVRHRVVIPDRLFFVDAVGKSLRQRLSLQLRARLPRPLRAFAPQGPRQRTDKQSRRFSQQVIVRRRVPRPVPRNEMTVLIDRLEPAGRNAGPPRPRKSPRPRRPAETTRTTSSPAARRARDSHTSSCRRGYGHWLNHESSSVRQPSCVTLLARQMPGLGQRHQLQVPVGLPEIFDIADHSRIAVVQLLPEHQRRLGPVRGSTFHGVEIRAARRAAKRHRTAVQNPVGRAAIALDGRTSAATKCQPRASRTLPRVPTDAPARSRHAPPCPGFCAPTRKPTSEGLMAFRRLKVQCKRETSTSYSQ
jgi:hypothetical protein